ncbi:MAG: response regulator [Geobacteraceae bacterium]|nr:response regulator [Geobacteraceae bacterium]
MNENRPSMKIVMIDDEEPIIESTMSFLADEGFITEGFSSHEQALAYIEHDPPNICLIDYRMPNVNAEELIQLIKQTNPDIRCLIYTGVAITLSDTLKQLGLSESDIIQKPIIDFDSFISLLRRQ